VHSHLHVHALPFSRFIRCPLVSTLHGAAWVRATHPAFLRYRDLPYVSLSDGERQLLPELNYVATVHNGIRIENFPYEPTKDDYLLFAGRLSPEKGPAEAVELARRTGRRLLIAGMIEPQHEAYFNAKVKPYIDGRNVEYLGLLSQQELAPIYRKAAALLFLISWCEPCGMVLIESLASGTPLIGTRFGSFPEIVVDGKTGFVVDSADQAVEAVGKLDTISPADCRADAEARFTAAVMAKGYEAAYKRITGSSEL
ncbi:MAG: glycosyltransferase, partial [Planctomycetes bacterium]|nr:glycosyltransferase [Planctomycetota bacterium]